MVTLSMEIVQTFYMVLIPAVVGSLLVYIFFDLGSTVAERVSHGHKETPEEVDHKWQD
ncbi:MAG: hypothetical protein M1319_01730 [Chloroflexi bacterium]|nr:hypothetical protein [Chloroflexota bacterium]